jgi:hypothetical protein
LWAEREREREREREKPCTRQRIGMGKELHVKGYRNRWYEHVHHTVHNLRLAATKGSNKATKKRHSRSAALIN